MVDTREKHKYNPPETQICMQGLVRDHVTILQAQISSHTNIKTNTSDPGANIPT